MEYMNLIPDEVETLIFKTLNYMDLKHYAQTSKARANLVYRHLAPIARRAREKFGLGPELSDQDIIERLYHVNGYTSSSFDNVTVNVDGWHGPGGSIIRPWRTPDDLLWYNSRGKFHREDGPAEIRYYPGIRYERWYINGLMHRSDGPAFIMYDRDDNSIMTKTWYRDDRKHRIDGPANIELRGTVTVKEWYREGRRHRIGGPAVIEYEGRNIIAKTWYEDDTIHRIGDPAVIEYYVDGNVKSEMWYEHDRMHRIGGPAEINYYTNGNVKSETWFENDKRHRIDGPVLIEYDVVGNVIDRHVLYGERYYGEQ